MSNAIAIRHNEMITRFKAIEAFVETKYANEERATLKELARKLKIPQDSIVYELNLWLKYCVRHDAPSNMIHKLGLFFSEDHICPKDLRAVSFTSEERRKMHTVSKQWELPGFTYIKLMKDLMLNDPDMHKRIGEQLATTEFCMTTLLRVMGLVTDKDTENTTNWEDYIQPLHVGNGNRCNVYSLRNENIDVWMYWARKTVEQHEAHKLIDPETQEIICLAPDNESIEKRLERKHACSRLNTFVKEMNKMGMILTKVTTQTDFIACNPDSGKKKYPTLHFTNPNDAMVDVSIKFMTFGEHGKFILN